MYLVSIFQVSISPTFKSSFCDNILVPKKCKPKNVSTKKAMRKTFILKSCVQNVGEIDSRRFCPHHYYFDCRCFCVTVGLIRRNVLHFQLLFLSTSKPQISRYGQIVNNLSQYGKRHLKIWSQSYKNNYVSKKTK